jgi:hypothetical protein
MLEQCRDMREARESPTQLPLQYRLAESIATQKPIRLLGRLDLRE